MGLESPRTVDAVLLHEATQVIVLPIFDDWDWKDEEVQLIALQEKLNTYFEFIETGQVFEGRPDLAGREVRIEVHATFKLSDLAMRMMKQAAEIAIPLGVLVTHRSEVAV